MTTGAIIAGITNVVVPLLSLRCSFNDPLLFLVVSFLIPRCSFVVPVVSGGSFIAPLLLFC